jgi:hypothetical protein
MNPKFELTIDVNYDIQNAKWFVNDEEKHR